MRAERFFTGEPVKAPIEAQPDPVTRQAIFDRVVRHYRAKPRRCPETGPCFYRFAGDKCFVGALIDDDVYVATMEGIPSSFLPVLFPLPQWFRDRLDFIRDLQKLHDNESNWPNGRMDMVLQLFAEERGLTMPG